MPFAREIRLLSLALLDSTSSISRPLSGLPANLYGPPSVRQLCSFPYAKYGMFSFNKVLHLNRSTVNRNLTLDRISMTNGARTETLSPQILASARSWMHTEVLNQNMTIKKSNVAKDERPLVVILSWMMAKGKHIEKYSDIYLKRGFDVLVVTLPPMDLLFPKSGSHVLASNIIKYLSDHKEYNKVIVHAFSVGAYILAEILVKLKDDQTKNVDIMGRLTGVILDSAVDFLGIPKGFPRAISKNPLMIKILEFYTRTHLKLMHETATRHYMKASETFHSTSFPCPTMFLVSDGDIVGNPADNTLLANNWKKSGVDVYFKCWPKSGHCAHIIHYPTEYVTEVENFLQKINLGIKAHL